VLVPCLAVIRRAANNNERTESYSVPVGSAAVGRDGTVSAAVLAKLGNDATSKRVLACLLGMTIAQTRALVRDSR
jgi:hypothetical protein